jgi:hypothetical protein
MGEAKRRKAAGHEQPRMIITGDDRARFANSELAGLVRNFGIGDIRSVSISTVWCDGVAGGSYHVEGGDRAKMIAQLEKVLAILRGELEAPPFLES